MDQSLDISTRVMDRLFAPKREGDVPYILCRRNEPIQHTYELHDYIWEGLTPVQRNGRTEFVIDHNFVLRIGIDGYCLIPDTAFNRKILDRIAIPKTMKVKHRKLDPSTGDWIETEVVETEKPQYERVQENVVEDHAVDRIIEKIFSGIGEDQLMRVVEAMRKGKTKEVAGTKSEPEAASESEPTTPKTSLPGVVKGTRRAAGGRPRAEVSTAA